MCPAGTYNGAYRLFLNTDKKIFFDQNFPNRINGSSCNANVDYEFEI
jgi:hypothetical protein